MIHADIKFVRLDYILRLRRERRSFPRRQEAEEEEGALFQPTSTTQAEDFKYVAVSHCWESREHPDPHGFQLAMLAFWISRVKRRESEDGNSDPGETDSAQQVPASDTRDESENMVFFIDYVSLYQFGNRTTAQETSFRRSMENMNLLYANSAAASAKAY